MMPNINQEILNANDAFYKAFTNTDILSMEKLWSSTHEIAVIHPGWPALHGREAVISSWRQIIETGNAPHIDCLDAKVCFMDTFAFVTCIEALSEGRLIATNIFIKEESGWKIVHHQAGPLPEPVIQDESQSLH